jgi:polyferredoxin
VDGALPLPAGLRRFAKLVPANFFNFTAVSGWRAVLPPLLRLCHFFAMPHIMREQVCKYMCPYARFQSAMFDNDTLIDFLRRPSAASRAARARKMSSSEESKVGRLHQLHHVRASVPGGH